MHLYQKKISIGMVVPAVFACSMAKVYATPLAIGTVPLPNATTVTCPTGAATGAVCKHFTVTGCKNASGAALADTGVTIGITKVTSPKGTIILQDGGGGTAFLDNGFANYYVGQGYNVVQTAYDAGSDGHGWQTGSDGVLYQACRPATVFQSIYSNTAAHTASTAFCGQGISGGGGTFAYALAHYANNITNHTSETQQYLFDYVLMASGPAVSRLDVGCATSQVYNNANIVNCGVTSYANSTLGTPVYGFPAYPSNPVDAWEGTQSCGTSSPSLGDISTWKRDSIISSGPNGHTGVFSYGATNVSFYYCGVQTNNQSLGLGWFLTQKIVPKNKTSQNLSPVNCYTDCTNEGVWNDPAAVTQTESDMASYCVLNTHS